MRRVFFFNDRPFGLGRDQDVFNSVNDFHSDLFLKIAGCYLLMYFVSYFYLYSLQAGQRIVSVC